MQKEAKSFVRRDKLIDNELRAQKIWRERGINQSEVMEGRKKFMVTFPYPYMNGRIHLGHAFSMLKAEYMARYKRLRGFNVLFPFGFHCTGMPICAAALKLKEEVEGLGIDKIKEKIKERNQAIQEKSTDVPKITQYEIMVNLEVNETEVPNFVDPKYWLNYFPPRAEVDLSRFGLQVDWRRSFITTDENPYYDSFVRWHFTKLKEADFIRFGMRPSIYSIKDEQMCADHDRSKGEGVNPQEYTLIKIKLLEFPESMDSLKEKDVFLVAATLRPETMYGQTNCYILPDGEYGCFETKEGEIFICSERSAKNMAYQNILKEAKKWENLCAIKGADLIGKAISAPLAQYEKVYIWPMLSISMGKGTGVVTSVPSDSPDDYAVLVDLKAKQPFREKYGLTDDMVLPFEPISIIDIPEYSDMSAVKAYEEFKIKSSNDKAKLAEAKDKTYKLGFNNGIMKVGEFAGKSITEAKTLIKQSMIDNRQAVTYYEPEGEVVSRSGEECVVAYIDQWYLPYGDPVHQKKVFDHVNSDQFNPYNSLVRDAFQKAIEWLKDWGCSRSFGLGTRLPWDEKYLIESLSDSTIYMAYYTVAHYLQSDLNGKEKGALGIGADELTIQDWDYIFLNKPYDTAVQKVEESKLQKMRESFRYWYPMDLRVSGKDLIRNHLTMSLYNHAAVWGDENMIPRGFFTNGWILVDGKKMSKSEGNFYTLKELCEDYGADASRIGLATSGDSLEDANLVMEEVNQGILKLSALEMWLKENLEKCQTLRENSPHEDNIEFYDSVFENELKRIIFDSVESYDSLVMRKVVEHVFFGLQKLREDYCLSCGVHGMRKDLFLKYVEYQLVLLYPMAPHFTEITWTDLFLPNIGDAAKNYPELISFATIPEVSAGDINRTVISQFEYLKVMAKEMNSNFDALVKKSKKKNSIDTSTLSLVNVIISDTYDEWQLKTLIYLKENDLNKENNKKVDWKSQINEFMSAELEGLDKKAAKSVIAKGLQFASVKMVSFILTVV